MPVFYRHPAFGAPLVIVGVAILSLTLSLSAAKAQEQSPPPPLNLNTATPPATGDTDKTPAGYILPVQINGQATQIVQHLFKFTSPYEGTNSLLSRNETEMSQTYTLFIGTRIKPNFEVYVDPEEAAGKGISNALGLAGFTNGEVIRNPELSEEPYLGRYFVRYTVATGKGRENVDPAENQVAGTQPIHRVVVTVGKLGVNDIFDVNSYANSARTQFMNWALLNNGAYDYAADTRGYSSGIAVEWVNPSYTLRAGSFQMPTVANGIDLARNISDNQGDQIELETHATLLAKKSPFVVRLLGYRNVADMGNYRESIALGEKTGTIPDITATRQNDTSKYGYGINCEQPLGDGGDTGVFVRYGWDNGATESFAYTEIDSALSLGGQISGAHWHRPKDRLAIAFADNGLSSAHRDYLAAGGLGFIIGDGALDYGQEQIIESYYTYQLLQAVGLSLDYQHIENPAYNRSRGPVSVLSFRVHSEF